MSTNIDFKIIAIKPLRGCNHESLKILKPGTTYYLYNNYKIERNSIRENPGIKSDFFSDSIPTINLSAIVGKNGTGKSSLIELLIQAINNISYNLVTHDDLAKIPRLKLEIYFKAEAYYKVVIREKATLYKQNLKGGNFSRVKSGRIFLQNFFYSVIVNYSHYGLNSNEIGTWVNGLFHKNDGYQTPIVINPMRTEGKIDINIENSLAKSRLVANLLRPSTIETKELLKITENLVAKEFKLTIKQPKRREVLYELDLKRFGARISRRDKKRMNLRQRTEDSSKTKGLMTQPIYFSDLKINQSDILRMVNQKYNFGYEGRIKTTSQIINLSHNYIIRKLVKIATTYPIYSDFFNKSEKNFVIAEFDNFLTLLFDKNENHISFKLKQTLNFLRYRHIPTPRGQSVVVDIDKLASKIHSLIKKQKLDRDATLQLLPPPIFETEILMKPIIGSRRIRFNTLSSGEKQLIYSVNSILYHLINLSSIKGNQYQVSYKFVNIVLEEIELYFHPDRQREFINFLIERIQDLGLQKIKGLNVCVVTHSPFILSDIPNNNILFLNEEGRPKTEAIKEKTFGANIHDLLKNNFFLEQGYMGQFAKRKIQSALEYLEDCQKNPRNKEKVGRNGWNKDKIKEFIELIGEPLIRNSLNELYLQVFVLSSDEEIDREIARLQRRKKRLDLNQ